MNLLLVTALEILRRVRRLRLRHLPIVKLFLLLLRSSFLDRVSVNEICHTIGSY
jgi:hypothetical protein